MFFSIVIPVYNEQDNITILLNEINLSLVNYKNNYEIIIVDDCSTDNTKQVLKNIKISNIKLIQNLKNKGQSFSIRIGIENSKYNTIVTIDGDLQNNPADIPKMLLLYEKNDFKLIGGIRAKRKDSLVKVFSSYLANLIRKSILNDGCIDTGCSLKIFDKEIFLAFPFF